MKRRVFLPALASLVAAPAPLLAQAAGSNQLPQIARDHARWQASRCTDARGRFSGTTAYVRTADFNGDGRPDYMLDSNALQCTSRVNPWCGSEGRHCPVTFFVSEGAAYRNAGSVNGTASIVTQGGRPVVRLVQPSGSYLFGWRDNAMRRLPQSAGGAAAPAQSAIRIRVAFDPRAKAILGQGRPLRGSIYYYGQPLPSYRGGDLDEEGRLNLTTQDFTIPAGGQVAVPTPALSPALLRQVRTPMVFIGLEPGNARVTCNTAELGLTGAQQMEVGLTCRGR